MTDSRTKWVDDLIQDIRTAWGVDSCQQRGASQRWCITNPTDGRTATMPHRVEAQSRKAQLATLKTAVGWEPYLAVVAYEVDKAARMQRDRHKMRQLEQEAEAMRAAAGKVAQAATDTRGGPELEAMHEAELTLQERLAARIEHFAATAVQVGKHRYDEIELSAELARQLTEHNREYSPVRSSGVHERTNRPKHPAATRQRWAKAMVNGHWELIPGGLAFDWYGFLLDGQNRLDAVLEAQEHWEELLDPTLSGYEKRRAALRQHGVRVPTVVSYDWDPEVFDRIDQGTPRNLSALLALEGFTDPKRLSPVVRLAYAYDHGLLDTPEWRKHMPEDHVLMEYAAANPRLSACLTEAWPMRIAHISLHGAAVALFLIRRAWPQTPAELAAGDVVADWAEGLRQGYTLTGDEQRLPLAVGDPRNALRFYLSGRRKPTRRIVGELHLGLLIKCWNACALRRPVRITSFGDAEEFPHPVERES